MQDVIEYKVKIDPLGPMWEMLPAMRIMVSGDGYGPGTLYNQADELALAISKGNGNASVQWNCVDSSLVHYVKARV